MKIIILLLASLLVNANSSDMYKTKLYEKVFLKLFNKSKVHLYIDSKDNIYKFNSRIKVIKNCQYADVVLKRSTCKNKPVFVENYMDFVNNKNAIGAFYYRKGRPQLKLNKDAIERFNLNIDSSLLKYVQ